MIGIDVPSPTCCSFVIWTVTAYGIISAAVLYMYGSSETAAKILRGSGEKSPAHFLAAKSINIRPSMRRKGKWPMDGANEKH